MLVSFWKKEVVFVVGFVVVGIGVVSSINGNLNSILVIENEDMTSVSSVLSSGDIVFFDDFEDGTLDKWNIVLGDWEVIQGR